MEDRPANGPDASRSRQRAWLQDRQASLILAAILLLIVASPIEAYWSVGRFLLAPTVVLVVIAAVHHTNAERWLFYLTLVLALAWIGSVQPFGPFHPNPAYSSAIMLGIVVLALGMMVRHVVNASKPDWQTLNAALSGYLLIGGIWAEIYDLILHLDSKAFSVEKTGGDAHGSMLYFSLQALTTLGFGDIAPVNSFARIFATVEAVIGQFYMATVIARLVTLAPRRSR